MDELLTDLKLSDKHKAFSREAKAGGRLRRGGEEATERLSKLFWAGETVGAGEANSSRFSLQGEGKGRARLHVEGRGEERVPIREEEEEEEGL